MGGEEDYPTPSLPRSWENKHLPPDNAAAREVAEERVQPANVSDSTFEINVGSQDSLGTFQGEAGGQREADYAI